MDRREFLRAAAAAGGALAAPGAVSAAFAAPRLEAQAVRLPSRAMRIDWSGDRRPVAIWASSDPDAQPALMRRLTGGARGGRAEFAMAVAPRPYFLLRTADGAQTRVAERLLPLQGGRNFRDVGGYRAADGRQVRWGRIYRSGVMADLTAADMSYLSALGIQVICDLRSHRERVAQPNPFERRSSPEVVGVDYEMPGMADLARVGSRAEAVRVMADSYVQSTEVLTPQFTEMFARLLRREILAFNCTAGKDRTGMGAALILSVLGVPRTTVLADYALTERYTPPAAMMRRASAPADLGLTPELAQAFRRFPPEVLQVIAGSDPAVMAEALTTLDARYGGPVALCKARYGLTDQSIADLRNAYLV